MSRRIRLCVLTTHPIQYMAPWYQHLAGTPWLDLHVLFARVPTPVEQGVGFGRAFTWDTPLLDGYAHSVLGLPAGVGHALRAFWRLRRTLAGLAPDAILVTGWNEPVLVAGMLAARSLGLPVLLRGESNDIKKRSWRVETAQRQLMRLPAAFLQIGQANRRFYLARGVRPESIFGGVYFVDNSRMLHMAQEHATEAEALRQSMRFATDHVVFAFCGKHVSFKQPLLLVEAAALARRNGLPAALLFAGSGPLTTALQARAEELGVPAHFCGFLNQTELWKAYLPADAFVLPSTADETWGLVTNEAMAFGLPVLVSNQVGCGEDLVLEGRTGLRFEPTADDLARAMRAIGGDRSQARRMGDAARQHVLAHGAMHVATAGLWQALQQLVPGVANGKPLENAGG